MAGALLGCPHLVKWASRSRAAPSSGIGMLRRRFGWLRWIGRMAVIYSAQHPQTPHLTCGALPCVNDAPDPAGAL